MSNILKDLKADLLKGCIEEEFEFAGRVWRMHTLSDGDSVWSYSYVSTASNMALLASRKAATLAAAISHIEGEPVDTLFDLPQDPKLQGFLANSPEELKSFYREKMFAFLSDLPDRVVTELFVMYETLEKRREEVILNLKKPLKGTSSSTSNNTSSPEPGPLVPTKTVTLGGSFGS